MEGNQVLRNSSLGSSTACSPCQYFAHFSLHDRANNQGIMTTETAVDF